eukprot:2172981-Alexandrium_andersonii.AAC.1
MVHTGVVGWIAPLELPLATPIARAHGAVADLGGAARAVDEGKLGAVALDSALWWTWASRGKAFSFFRRFRRRRRRLAPEIALGLVGRLELDLAGGRGPGH